MNKAEAETLKELSNIGQNIEHFTYEQLKYAIGFLIPNLPISLREYHRIWRPKEDWQRDLETVHRARINKIPGTDTYTKYSWPHEKDISHVPLDEPKLIKEYGRCNRPNEIVFYCSNYAPTSCYEVLTKGFTKEILRHDVTIGHWKIVQPLTLAQINFSLPKLKELQELTGFKYDHLMEMAGGWREHTLATFAKKGN